MKIFPAFHAGASRSCSQIRGAVYGALVGDALGVPVEFTSREQRRADPVREMRADGAWRQPAGTWSDDGALTLCSVEALAGGASLDTNRLGQLFVDWMQNARWAAHDSVFDIGITTHVALERIREGTNAECAGGDGERHNGNGSLMRILPVALRFSETTPPAELATLAMRASAITHAHIRSRLACACYCLIAQQLMLAGRARVSTHSRSLAAGAVRKGTENFLPLLAAHPDERPHFARIAACEFDTAVSDSIRSGGYVMDTLEASIWCLLNHDTFAETVLSAVNLGGDTDTTGCVAGGIAGLLYGYEAIPPAWIDVLPKRASIDTLLERFAATTNATSAMRSNDETRG